MNWKQETLRMFGLMAMMLATFSFTYAQPGEEQAAEEVEEAMEEVEEAMEEVEVAMEELEEVLEEVSEEMESAGEEVVVVMDTTEIAWRDKKFVIISEDGVKRVEIVELDDEDGDDDDFDWEEEFNPEYEVKEHVGGGGRGYSNVDLLAFDLGFLNYYSANGFFTDAITASPDLEVRDFRVGSHVALHLFPTTVSLIGRGAVNLQSAITIDWSNHYFKGNNIMVETDDGFEWQDTGINYEKNKLTVRYAQIPLLLNINSAPRSDNGVSISAGGYVGLLWNARTKQVSSQEGTVKIDGDFGLTRVRYGLMGRIDFKWFDFYVMYNLTPMFEDSNPTDAQTVVAGINIIDF